jgi:hypothetical protein
MLLASRLCPKSVRGCARILASVSTALPPTVARKSLCVGFLTFSSSFGAVSRFSSDFQLRTQLKNLPWETCATGGQSRGILRANSESCLFPLEEHSIPECALRAAGWRKYHLPLPKSPHMPGSVLAKSRCQNAGGQLLTASTRKYPSLSRLLLLLFYFCF